MHLSRCVMSVTAEFQVKPQIIVIQLCVNNSAEHIFFVHYRPH